MVKRKKRTEEKLLNSKEVAHILDLSPDDVIMLARKKKLPATKIGRFWRFNPVCVSRYIANANR